MKYKILIADDNQRFVEAFKFQLHDFLGEDVDYIDEAANGDEAIEKSTTRMYNYIFMDINMPVKDGIMATKAISSQNLYVKIIAISFHTEFEFIKRIIEAGARAYILKEDISQKTLSNVLDVRK